jgi:hypothetical protein
MEINISFSVKISIDEARANINDIVKEIKQVLQETGKYLLKQILKGWEERIVTAFCQGPATIPHRRKGRRGESLLGEKGMDKERANSSGERFHYSSGGFKVKTSWRLNAEVVEHVSGLSSRWLGLAPYQREEIGSETKR